MEKKKSVLLLISAILGCAYLAYSIVYWLGVNSGSGSTAESIGSGIATAIVFPHLIATAIAVIFNLIGWIMDRKWLALTGAIMYTVAMIFFPLYFMFVVAEMILSYIGFARMIGKEKQARQVRTQQPAPRMTENALGDLDSKKLVHADAMVRYCKHFGFDRGLSDAVCKDLFSKAERSVAPDTEVVMAFVAQYPAETGVLCACVFAVHKLILAAQDNVLKLPTDQIGEISLSGDAKKVIIQCGGINYDLGVDAHQVNSILDFLRRSKDACMVDIQAENAIKKYRFPEKVDGHPLQYEYERSFIPEAGVNIVADILDGEERLIDARPTEKTIELSLDGKVFGIIHDDKKAEMLSDWNRKGFPCQVVLLDTGASVNIRFYRDKRIGNEFREQTVVRLTKYKDDYAQQVIELLDPGDELKLEEISDDDDNDIVEVLSSDEYIGQLPAKATARYLEEGAYGAFFEKGQENDDGIIIPYVRIYW